MQILCNILNYFLCILHILLWFDFDFIREDMAKFKPVFIKSQFTHVYAVVCCEEDCYYLTVYTEKSVPLFGPSVPSQGFGDKDSFRLVNSKDIFYKSNKDVLWVRL